MLILNFILEGYSHELSKVKKKKISLWSIGLKAGFIPTVQNLAHDYTTIKLADLPPFPLKLFSSQDLSWISTILGSWQDYTTRLQGIFQNCCCC